MDNKIKMVFLNVFVVLILYFINIPENNLCFASGCTLGGSYAGKKETRETKINLVNPKKKTFEFLTKDDITKQDKEKIVQKGLALFSDFKDELSQEFKAKAKTENIWLRIKHRVFDPPRDTEHWTWISDSRYYSFRARLSKKIFKKIIESVNGAIYKDFNIYDCRSEVPFCALDVTLKSKKGCAMIIGLRPSDFYIVYYEKENKDDLRGICYTFHFISDGYEATYKQAAAFCKDSCRGDLDYEPNGESCNE